MSHTFFFREQSPFSNWHKKNFELYGKTFNCGEQAMMWSKAMLFGDTNKAEEIMNTKEPRDQKKLGREVGGFDQTMWDSMQTRVMYNIMTGKFKNADMWQHLERTKDTTMVEASPYDKIWGIGLSEYKAKQTPESQWPGQNLLGKMLTKYRNDRYRNKVKEMTLDDILEVGVQAKQNEVSKKKSKSHSSSMRP